MNRLDEFIEVAHIKFMEFFDAASDVSEIEEQFNLDAFSDITMLNKPVIFISPKEIASTHQLLVEHKKEVGNLSFFSVKEIWFSLPKIKFNLSQVIMYIVY